MSYTPDWTNGDAAGHVLAGDAIHAADVNELEAAINRRLKVMFGGGVWPVDFAVAAGEPIAGDAIAAIRAGFGSLMPAGGYFVHSAGWEQLSLWAQWLYPAGGDEDKIVVPDGKPPGGGEVGFFAKLNGQAGWTGGLLGAPAAMHINEPRDAAAMLCRGRYTLRVGDGGAARASKDLPGGLWYPPAVARDGSDAMHSWFGGRQWLWPDDGTGGCLGPRGQGVTVRSARLRLRPQGDDAKIALYHCKRNVNTSAFSWTHYDSDQTLAWATAGGTGSADADLLANLELRDGIWSERDVAGLAQQMFDGQAEPTFMIAADEETGWPDDPTHIDVELVIDFHWTEG